MKAFILILLSGVAFADLPRLTIKQGGQRQDLRVDEVAVTVRVEGDLVETRMSLNFFNATNRNQEGEFHLPLPESASVNHYALEVNGKMREATVVEKKQARRAYETIKARNIDPGLVEKMEGNVYRTRIFPILPLQTKRVSIGYVQPLEKSGDKMIYRLPFGVAENIGKFQLKIEGDLAGVTPEMDNRSKLLKDGNRFSLTSENSPVIGDLVLSRAAPGDGFSGEIREVNGESFAYVRGIVPPEIFDQKLKKPKTLTVVWDASANGYSRDLKAELKFLDKVLDDLGEVAVRLMIVHGKVEDLGEFRDRKKLRASVQAIFYDGAADWRQIDFSKLEGERILLFGGDDSVLPITYAHTNAVFQVVRSAALPTDKVLAEMAKDSGGEVIDLANQKNGKAAQEGFGNQPQVMKLAGAVESFFSETVDGQVRIFAKMTKGDADEVVVSLGRGGEVKKSISVNLKRADGGNALRDLWAQRRLEDLIHQKSLIVAEDETEIIAHCKSYGLVSDFTSLIVLERMQDHIEFRIPPPEPELLAEYQNGLKNVTQSADRLHLTDSWIRRIRWHLTDFPWVEATLLPRYARVKKWTDAQTSVFEKDQLAQTNLAEFLTWKKQAEALMRQKNQITDQAKFVEWEAQLAEMRDSGEKLGTTNAKLPEKGEFGVSVRGLVQEPQTLILKNGATLRAAIKNAGGFNFAGSKSQVAVYRSGKRSVYNLLSKFYEDVELLPGDMIVAMDFYHGSGASDPFSSGDQSSSDPREEPAVTRNDLPLSDPSQSLGLGDPFAGGSDGGTPMETFPLFDGVLKEATFPVTNTELIDGILNAANPLTAYRQRRKEMNGGSADFAKVAGKLYANNDSESARRVLSNLYAGNGFHVPSLRAAAYWMIQFEDDEGAFEIFETIARNFPADALLKLDLMRLKRIAGGTVMDSRFRNLPPSKTDLENDLLAEMRMMERNRFQVDRLENLTKHLPSNLEVFPSDLRIVVYCSDPNNAARLEITDPTGSKISWSGISVTGGRLVSVGGVAEFMQRRAIPGDHHLELGNVAFGTCQIEVFINWGKENESRRVFTLSGNGKAQSINAGLVTFDFGQPEE